MAGITFSPYAPLAGAILTNQDWHTVHRWELEDGSEVSIFRKGEKIGYQWKNADQKIKGSIKTHGNADAALEDLLKCSPLRVGDKIRFIRPSPSQIDPTQNLTRDIWALTLVCSSLSRDCLPLRTGFALGHSMILLEKIDEQGMYNRIRIHLAIDREGKLAIEVTGPDVARFDPEWPRTETYLRRASLVNQMVQSVLEQKRAFEDAYASRTPLPFNYVEEGSREGTQDKNCHSWCVETLSIAKVRIPLVGLDLPFHPNCYIPRYSVGSLSELCQKMIKRGYPVENLLEESERNQVQSLEIEIEKKKNRSKRWVLALRLHF